VLDEDWGEEADRSNRVSYDPQKAIEKRMVGSFYKVTLKKQKQNQLTFSISTSSGLKFTSDY